LERTVGQSEQQQQQQRRAMRLNFFGLNGEVLNNTGVVKRGRRAREAQAGELGWMGGWGGWLRLLLLYPPNP